MAKTTVRSGQVRDTDLLVDDFKDFGVVDAGGLGVTVKAGRVRNDNTITDKSDQPLTLTDNTTNFVEIDNVGTASFNTSAFTSGRIPLATVVTASGDISSITDKRAWTALGGSGTTPGDLSETTKELWIALGRTKIVEDQSASRPASTVGDLHVDVFTDDSGIDSALSSGYEHRTTPDFDVIALPAGIALFRPDSLSSNLQGYWKLDEKAPEVITASGNAQIDTAQSKFGGASALFDGTGDYLIAADSPNFDLSRGTFTIDFWVRPNSLGSAPGTTIISQSTDANNYFQLRLTNGGEIALIVFESSSQVVGVTTTAAGISTGTWYHVAVVENRDTYKIFIDGTQNVSTTETDRMANYGQPLNIGRNQAAANEHFDGWIDELRISNVARWSSNFTPETSAYVSDINTMLLMHMDGTDASTTFVDSSGSAVRIDSSTNGNDLSDNSTVGNNPDSYWDAEENSGNFEASNSEYLSITDASQTGLDITSSYTIAGWARLESTTAGQAVVGKGSSAFIIELPSATSSTSIGVVHNSTRYNLDVGTLTTGKWFHFAVVFIDSGDLLLLFIDGNFKSLVGTVTANPTDNTNIFTIGQSGNGANYFDGDLKDVAIWNTNLVGLQIKSLALGVDLSTYTFRPDSLSSNLQGYWKLNGISGGTGAVPRPDSSGNGNTLTDNNTVASAAGYIESVGADFERDNSETLSITDASQTGLDITGDLTVASWIKLESLNDQFVVSKWDTTLNQRSYILGVLSTGLTRFIVSSDGTAGGGTIVTGSTVLTTGVWYHIAGVHDAANDEIRVYVDGKQDATPVSHTTGIFNGSASFLLGGHLDNGVTTQHFDGLVSDVAIWNTVLSDANVASLASGLPLQQQGIVSYYKLNETSGSRLDSFGSNDLTDNNTVLSAAGQVGNAADFEADNSESLSVAHGNQVGLDLRTAATVMAWTKRESTGVQQEIAGKWNGADDSLRCYVMDITSLDFLRFNAHNGSSFNTVTGSTAISTSFVHAVGMLDGANLSVYLNSAPDATPVAHTGGIRNSIESFQLGAINGASVFFDGLMDEVLIASRYFREEEIKTAYVKGLNGKELISSEAAVPTGTAVVISNSWSLSQTPSRALVTLNKSVTSGTFKVYVSRVASPGTNLADTTKWTQVTEESLVDITGQDSGSTARWAAELSDDSELNDIAVTFGVA